MRPITRVDHTYDVTDEVLAQAIAAAANWQRDDSGAIFDQQEIYVGASLTEVAIAMRNMGWLSPLLAQTTGVNWRALEAILDEDEKGTGTAPTYRRAGDLTRRAVRDVRQAGY